MDDPHTLLGVEPSASDAELTAAYRRLAKQWHPDHGGGEEAAGRMAQINAAYDLLRAAAWQRAPAAVAPEQRSAPSGPGRRTKGDWLAPAVRRALGRELVAALVDGEEVSIVTPVATWASPRAVLAVTDRRLLWLHDDAVSHRVRSLPFRAIAEVDVRVRRPLRRTATLRIRTANGRRFSFAELRPETADAIARRAGEAA